MFEAFTAWVTGRGIELYPAQEEALLELVSGNNVVLSTPTGSGKSLVAVGAHFDALAAGRGAFYTAPIKALVSEKFFALCEVFGADERRHGDRRRRGQRRRADHLLHRRDPGQHRAARRRATPTSASVVMDEFHYYADPDRGWAWQVPLLELPQAQFLLMSATLGDVTRACGGPDPAHRPRRPPWSPAPSARCRCTSATR